MRIIGPFILPIVILIVIGGSLTFDIIRDFRRSK